MSGEESQEFYGNTLPDVFGYTIFCDDIRGEIGNKFSAMGMYPQGMHIHTDFPVTLKSFGMLISYAEKIGTQKETVRIEVLFPGQDEPVATFPLPAEQFRALSPPADDPEMPPALVYQATIPVSLGPVVIQRRGAILVIARFETKVVRLGILRVEKAPTDPTQVAARKEAAN